MSNAFRAGGFGSGQHTDQLMQAFEQLRSQFEQKVGRRAGRGDVRAAVLALLAEEPKHGYQIIRDIEERSGGAWKPSAGSVYPTLQLLTDEGLVSSEESGGRKTYALTAAGREVADAEGATAWTGAESTADAPSPTALPRAGVELAQAAAQLARTGTPDQVQEGTAVLEEARRKLYSILAQG